MEKSKLKISVNLFAALLYFMGAPAGGIIPVLIASGYILIVEENEKLKRTAVKAFILTLLFSLLTSLMNWLSASLASFFNMLASTSARTIYDINDLDKFDFVKLFQTFSWISSNLTFITYFFAAVIMVVLGFRAYKQIDIKIKWIDKILDKHF